MPITISYAITVKDELKEIQSLIERLLKYKTPNDEIIVVFDEKTNDKLVKDYLQSQEGIKWFPFQFNNNFADLKNYMNINCNSEWIFHIDADEIPDEMLLTNLESIVDANNEIDVIWVPRINMVEGLTQEHITKWRWNVNEQGWVNWPHDAQCRIYKNLPSIHWVNRVHEKLVGYKSYSKLPDKKEFSLWHIKQIDRQERQNSFYERILDEI